MIFGCFVCHHDFPSAPLAYAERPQKSLPGNVGPKGLQAHGEVELGMTGQRDMHWGLALDNWTSQDGATGA